MNGIDINLIRDHTPPPPRRKKLFLGMLFYLGVFGLLLVWQAHYAARCLVLTQRYRAEIDRMESGFRATHSEGDRLAAFADGQSREMADALQSLKALRSFYENRVLLANLILGLSSALPPETELQSMNFDGEGASLTFTIVEPAEDAVGRLHPGDYIRQCSDSPLLRSQISGITHLATERQRIDGVSVVAHRFKGTFIGGDLPHGSG